MISISATQKDSPNMVDLADFISSVTPRMCFSKYPTQEECDALIQSGYTIFVDVTTPGEITPGLEYILPEHIKIMRYPIPDREPPPKDTRFTTVIDELVDILDDTYPIRTHKICVFCRGGHGRSAVVAAILYAIVWNVDAGDALEIVHAAHQKRKEMKSRWRIMGAPQTKSQKAFVIEYVARYKKKAPKYLIASDGYYDVSVL